MGDGFQKYVAFRYLLDRPRRVSLPILLFVLLGALILCGGAFTGPLKPFAVGFIRPWIRAEGAIALSIVLAGAPLLAGFVVLHRLLFKRWSVFWLAQSALMSGVSLLVAASVPPTRLDTIWAFEKPAPLVGAAFILWGICGLCVKFRHKLFFRFCAVGILVGVVGAGLLAFCFNTLPSLELETVSLFHGVLALAGAGAIFVGSFLSFAKKPGWWLLPLGASVFLTGLAWVSVGILTDRAVLEASSFMKNAGPLMALVLPVVVGCLLLAFSLSLLIVRHFFTFFTTVSIGGVAIGGFALVCVLSVMGGFENDLREKILGSNAHLLVERADDTPFTEYREVQRVIAEDSAVVANGPYLISEVVVAANRNYGSAIMKGVDPVDVGRVTDLVKYLQGRDKDKEKALLKLWPLSPAVGTGEGDRAAADKNGNKIDKAQKVDAKLDQAPDDMDLPEDEPILLSPPPKTPEEAIRERLLRGTGPADDAAELDDLFDDFDTEAGPDDFTDVPYMEPGAASLPGIFAGKELANQVALHEGQTVQLISPLGIEMPGVGTVPRVMSARVGGTFFTGMYEYDLKLVYVELGELQGFLDLGDQVNGIEIRVADPTRTGPVKKRLIEKLGKDYRVKDWKEINKSLFSALKLEKIAMFMVLAITILVASFSIVGNLIMVVVEKSREIAILKTLGSKNREVLQIFIVQGFFIGLVGTFVGVSLGLAACLAAQAGGFPLDPNVYYIDRLPIHIEPMSVLAVALAGIVISVLATLYPAKIASSTEVVRGLRRE